MSSVERDPKKRRVKPIEQPCVIDFDEESSDDSDFRIEDHPDVSDDDIDSLDSGGGNDNDSSNDSDAESDDSELDKLDALRNLNPVSANGCSSVGSVLERAERQAKLSYNDIDDILICCGCLGDHSDSVNEIVECDSCGVTVHEACYGISESNSLASTNSLSPTAPWFCEACKAGVKEPVCELCPNSGGIFKETDVGKWVHLICALYVPGVAFGEVDKLTSVTLFEMQYSKWGAKTCILCSDSRFARTGVCIGCDAGMCRTYFHVTCAQREGFLSEAHCEEVDQADPFYAHCKLHSDKTLVKRRKRNYLALQVRNGHRKIKFQREGHMDTPEQVRIQRKLAKQRVHYLEHKKKKNAPWVPTQKMPRLITTSASACRKLLRKAELMGIDTSELEMHDAQIATLADIRKKWHIPPAFTVEFIAYYLDRNERLRGMKNTLEQFIEENKALLNEQQTLREQYDQLLDRSNELMERNTDLKADIQEYHSTILSACPTKNLPNIGDIGKPPAPKLVQQIMAVPTAAALKMGVGFPLKNIPLREREDRVLSSQAKASEPLQLNECGICRQRTDQHLLAKCDTCHLYYHTNCLNPPLARLPKKSKLYGWQCSECDKSSDSEVDQVKTPRRSRSVYCRDRSETEVGDVSSLTPKIVIKPMDHPEEMALTKKAELSQKGKKERRRSSHNDKPKTLDGHQAKKVRKHSSTSDTNMVMEHTDHSTAELLADLGSNEDIEVIMENSGHMFGYEGHKSKKRRRDKHKNRYSPELGMSSREHKRKRKKKSVEVQENIPHPRITIKIKSIPLPAGEVASESNPQCFYVPNEADDNAPALSVILKSDKLVENRRTSSDVAGFKKNRTSIKKASVSESLSDTSTAKDPLALDEPPVVAVGPSRSSRGSAPTRTSASKPSSFIPAESLYCYICQQEGVHATAVRCDECLKLYHFSCLDPPLKSSPKKRGYSWHCADCDPTGSE